MEGALLEGSMDGSYEGMYGEDGMDLDNSPSEKGDGGTGLGKGKGQLALQTAKNRFGTSRMNYQKMKMAEMSKKRGIKSKMRGVFGVPGLGLQVSNNNLSVSLMFIYFAIATYFGIQSDLMKQPYFLQ